MGNRAFRKPSWARESGMLKSCVTVPSTSWVICWKACCCFWICSAKLSNIPSHSCLASSGTCSAARSIRLLVFLSIIFSLLEPSFHTLCGPALGTPVPSAEHYDQVARKIDALHLFGHVFLDVASR